MNTEIIALIATQMPISCEKNAGDIAAKPPVASDEFSEPMTCWYCSNSVASCELATVCNAATNIAAKPTVTRSETGNERIAPNTNAPPHVANTVPNKVSSPSLQ